MWIILFLLASTAQATESIEFHRIPKSTIEYNGVIDPTVRFSSVEGSDYIIAKVVIEMPLDLKKFVIEITDEGKQFGFKETKVFYYIRKGQVQYVIDDKPATPVDDLCKYKLKLNRYGEALNTFLRRTKGVGIPLEGKTECPVKK